MTSLQQTRAAPADALPADADVAVVGSGVAGMATALGLAQQGMRIALVGPRIAAHRATDAEPFDARIYALAPATAALLQRLSVWARIDAARLTSVETMRVFADRGDALTFDAYGASVERLATIGEESALLQVLDTACDYQPAITRHAAAFEGASGDAGGVTLQLAGGAALRVRLLVGADGAGSAVRAAAGIGQRTTDYEQIALVSNFRCAKPHLNTAWQWFTDEGVVALLPLPGDHVSLVWSAPKSLAPSLLELTPEQFAQRVTERSGSVLGELQPAGIVASFPLRLIVVDRLIAPRVALVGDAAHVVHPLAGQGLNLGLQDVAALLEVVRGREAFRDIGDTVLLRRYERSRAEPVAMMRTATDGLARMFRSDDPLARFVRNTGMAAVDRLGLVKRLLIRQALG